MNSLLECMRVRMVPSCMPECLSLYVVCVCARVCSCACMCTCVCLSPCPCMLGVFACLPVCVCACVWHLTVGCTTHRSCVDSWLYCAMNVRGKKYKGYSLDNRAKWRLGYSYYFYSPLAPPCPPDFGPWSFISKQSWLRLQKLCFFLGMSIVWCLHSYYLQNRPVFCSVI